MGLSISLRTLKMKQPTKQTSNLGFRSGLERKVATHLESKKIPIRYEEDVLLYTIPKQDKSYCPDFKLPDDSYLEVKGWLKLSDRQKMIHVKRSNPDIKIRFVFSNPENKIYAGSKTTYGNWCDYNGFEWCWSNNIPDHWLHPISVNEKGECIDTTKQDTEGSSPP